VCPGESLTSLFPLNSLSAIWNAEGPLTRTTEIAPSPGGVAIAAIVSSEGNCMKTNYKFFERGTSDEMTCNESDVISWVFSSVAFFVVFAALPVGYCVEVVAGTPLTDSRVRYDNNTIDGLTRKTTG
jgi:hypothetical protein